MPAVLVTGGNRGMGLEWVRQYAEAGWRVYATCRRPEAAEALRALAARHPRVSLHRLDVTRPEQVAEAPSWVEGGLDVLVNNAGVYLERWDRDPLGAIDYAAWEETFRVNTLGPVRVTEALTPALEAVRGRVVAVTSHMGSIGDIQRPRSYAYRSSKAALNAAMRGLALELGERGVGVLLVHPGWVRTDMGGPEAPLAPQEAVAAMRRLVADFRPGWSGRFLRYDGEELPW